MNRSYSKLRHIQESNIKLEKIRLKEQNTQPQSFTTQQNGMGANLRPENNKQSKEFLIQVLIDKLNNMKSDTRWQPNQVAQTIINNCNNFLQKRDIFQ